MLNAATCTRSGRMAHVCTVCGRMEIEDIPATGHTFVDDRIAASCTSAGCVEHVCSDCGYSYATDPAPMLGHTFVETGSVEPTCTTDGYTTYECSVCGAEDVKYVAATGEHDYGDGDVCSVCGHRRNTADGVLFTLSEDRTYYSASYDETSGATEIYIPAAFVAVSVAADRKEDVAGLILTAPAFSLADEAVIYYQTGSYFIMAGETFIENAYSYCGKVDEMLSSCEAKTLILHGDKDKLVDISYSEKAAETMPDASLIAIKGAGHNYDFEEIDFIQEKSSEFLDSFKE